MTAMRKAFITGALAALPLLAGGTPAGAVEPGKTFGDWQTECETPPDGKPRCFLSQTRVMENKEAKQATRILKASVGYFAPDGKGVMVVILPLGVDLRAGAALTIDDGKPLPLTYQQCIQDGCLANAPMDEATLTALRRSKGAQITVRPYGGTQAVAFPLSTKGITDGLAALKP
ncbi:invasion associated locus B family protein [Azospirillum argentinense]|uniref:Invasion associated locus B family protein n=1 Tax=Azospirillum argentinense TaxID=2970906 RepID=A0A2K1FVI9_9PROT|nr:invasion associated locus B family protein [Azospirillum argentinense]MBK3801942.1 invasion associated locus B family protein [Azospirillum argentinense]PNQ96508.1 invasion associated locus B family protein [Azospirillum argentinense]